MSRPPAAEWSSRRFRESAHYKKAAKSLGLRVRQLREQKNLTLEKAAELADMDLTHWQKVEAGTLNPTLVTFLRIAAGLDEPLDSLFRAPGPRKGAAVKKAKGRGPSPR